MVDSANSIWRKTIVIHISLCVHAYIIASHMRSNDGHMYSRKIQAPPSPWMSLTALDHLKSTSASVGRASQGGSVVDAPLRGFSVYIVGRLSQYKSELKVLVESLGGRMVKEVSDDTTIC